KLYARPIDRLKQMLLPGRRWFTEVKALGEVSFTLPRGEAFGVLGRNGAGKSTLLQIVAGTLTPTSGEVRVGGRVAALLELGSGFNAEFTGRENVFLSGAVLGLDEADMQRRYPEIVAFADIGEFIDRPVKTYSSGMFLRLAFAVATSVDPDLLIVDEALAVGDIRFQQRCITRIRQMREAGVSILFVSHDLESVKRICDRAIVLEDGVVVREGAAYEVADWYLARMIGAGIAERADADAAEAQQPVPLPSAASLTDGLRADFKWLRHGDGNGEIVRVEMINSDGIGTTVARLDEQVTFRFDVRYKIDLPSCGFGFYLRDRLGTDVIGANTFQEFQQVGPVHKGDLLRYEFKLPLSIRPGAYGVSPAAAYSQEELRFLDWINNALVIEIVDPTPKHMVFGICHPKVQTTVRVLSTAGDAPKAAAGRTASA
ncbi:MAG TPA: ABC transporter ATP-binding protein, partial [Planctomycetota bacterium]|nr:ABC transporter ATP-binding protein [Planctomycetota bacterium]